MFNLMPDTVKEDMPTRYLSVEYIEGQVQRNADKLIREHNIDILERIRYSVEYYIQHNRSNRIIWQRDIGGFASNKGRCSTRQIGGWQRIYVANKGYMAVFPMDIELFQDSILWNAHDIILLYTLHR